MDTTVYFVATLVGLFMLGAGMGFATAAMLCYRRFVDYLIRHDELDVTESPVPADESDVSDLLAWDGHPSTLPPLAAHRPDQFLARHGLLVDRRV